MSNVGKLEITPVNLKISLGVSLHLIFSTCLASNIKNVITRITLCLYSLWYSVAEFILTRMCNCLCMLRFHFSFKHDIKD